MEYEQSFVLEYGVVVADDELIDQWDVFVNLSGDSLAVYTPRVISRWFDPLMVVDRKGAMVHNHSCDDLYNGVDDGNCPIDPLDDLNNPNDRGSLYGINSVTSSSCPTGLRPTHIYEFPEKWHKRWHYSHYRNGTFHNPDFYL